MFRCACEFAGKTVVSLGNPSEVYGEEAERKIGRLCECFICQGYQEPEFLLASLNLINGSELQCRRNGARREKKDRQTDRQTNRQKVRQTETERKGDREVKRNRDKQTGTKTNIHSYKETQEKGGREGDRRIRRERRRMAGTLC